MEICYYDKSLDEAAKVLTKLRKKFPRLALFFCGKRLLMFLWFNDKLFNPLRKKIYSQKKYEELYKELKKFNYKLFIKWLTN